MLTIEGADDLSGTLDLSATPAASATSLLTAATASVTASGTLKTNGGATIPLTGTYDGDAFNVTGGGYSITATVTGSTLSGTGTAPGGQAVSVTGLGGTTSTSPAGTYAGSYALATAIIYNNSRDRVSCQWVISISGSIKMQITGTTNNLKAEWVDTFTERQLTAACSFPFPNGAPITVDGGYIGPSPIRHSESETGGSNGVTMRRLHGLEGSVITLTGGEVVFFGTVTHFQESQAPPSGPGPPGLITSSGGASIVIELKKQ